MAKKKAEPRVVEVIKEVEVEVEVRVPTEDGWSIFGQIVAISAAAVLLGWLVMISWNFVSETYAAFEKNNDRVRYLVQQLQDVEHQVNRIEGQQRSSGTCYPYETNNGGLTVYSCGSGVHYDSTGTATEIFHGASGCSLVNDRLYCQ